MMRGRQKVMLAAYAFLELLNGIVDELYFSSALFADKVVVMMEVTRFIANETFFKIDGRCYACFTEKLQRAVNSDLTDSAVRLANKEEQFSIET